MRLICDGKAVVTVLGGVAMAGKVLIHRQDALRGEPPRARPRHGRGGIRVRRECAAADDGIGRIRIYVRHRRKVHREAVAGEITADRAAHVLGIRRIPRRAHGGGALVFRQTEGGVIGKPRNKPAFLVHAEEQRHRCRVAQLFGERAERFGVGDIFAEDRNAADRICREHRAHIVRERFHALGLRGIDLFR